ncbi:MULTISPECIES: helix-turn-helix domain-containing protein [Nitrospirillum]|uniref:AraC family transcriptional regulator n=1 Tax=Nitrospirillum amazonense TaxID=28077 RepID=A0A560FXU5_9PROT|nr:AraC family transcriptional regulator [Nitrospirillum amazonense]MEC4593550.1 AraC family transcriptional regulator [Nitrospirillum amazonense]TWB26401.1 AraC family transcriptional regulator [Nitrospirillum amazonense]
MNAAALDLFLRGGVVSLLVLLAGRLLAEYPRVNAARLGALFAVGSAAYTLCTLAGVHAWAGVGAAPLMGLATANSFVFWLFACSLFDDAFRPRAWHGLVWLALAATGLTQGLVLVPGHHAAARPLGLVLDLQPLLWAGLAAWQSVATAAADLVEPRRRLRLFIVAAAALHSIVTALATLAGPSSTGREQAAGASGNLLDAAGLLTIAGIIAWSLLRVGGGQALFHDRCPPVPAVPPAPESEPAAVDPIWVTALERAMRLDRAYRRDGLTIGQLAVELGLPEYRLRRLINQGLGHRNFNAFLNHYRLAEAKAALADPAQAEVPILTIALDAGFGSLGPFNRAFKADTGLTPGDYRRQALAEPSKRVATASRISNPA